MRAVFGGVRFAGFSLQNECPKHVEHIISEIKEQVTSSWSSIRQLLQ